jgi:hypothetical protein
VIKRLFFHRIDVLCDKLTVGFGKKLSTLVHSHTAETVRSVLDPATV